MEHLSQLRRLGLFDAKVPRYTSIRRDASSRTTSPARVSVVDAADPRGPRSRSMCMCPSAGGCAGSAPAARRARAPRAGRGLCRNAQGRGRADLRAILPRGRRNRALHWGGGTPTLLTPDLMHDLADTDHARFRWTTMPNSRSRSTRTRSTHPGSTRWPRRHEPRLDRRAGFRPEIQQTIGRIQSYEVTRDAVDMRSRARGIQA
jgi:oxygen-independent coproporphyrinogen-3 oxidase